MSSTKLAHSILRQLIENGVSHFVLSPGSRNAPLSLALHEAAEKAIVDLHIRIDERGAGFFALGLSKASENYVAVICTSGTAAANYHPAALEAYHSKNKVIFITADRPARLRETGANQTTVQVGVLAPLNTHDISTSVDISSLLNGGPVHLNVQFDEPLLSNEKQNWLDALHVTPYFDGDFEAVLVEAKSRSVIIVGHDKGTFNDGELEDFLTESNLPIISEDPLSTPGAIAHASLFLADADIRASLKADQIFVIGRTTLSRSINAYISECSNVTVIDPRVMDVDSKRTATSKFTSLPFIESESDPAWISQWNSLSHLELPLHGWSEQVAVKTIVEAIPEGSALFVGSSRPVRDIEACTHYRPGIRTYANRGLAGIDGNISTALGIAETYQKSYSILGDLTFLHDLSALVNTNQVDHCLFIIDNNGGGIFSTLPQAGSDGFEKVFGTPHGLDIAKLIEGFGLEVVRVKNESDIRQQVNKNGLRFVVVEVPSRDENAAGVKALHQSAANAARIGANLA